MKSRAVLAAGVLSTLVLTGCGTTDAAVTEESTDAGGGGDPVTVTDHRGEELTLEEPADEVVTLEWSVTEYVASMGVQPVGVADPAGYESWASSAPLEDSVTDVGLRTEPSIDTIAGLEPDLILADVTSIPDDAMEQLERIAPVVVLSSASTEGLLERVESNQETVGQLLGKEEEAQQLSEEFDQALEQARTTISEAGMEGTPMAFAYPTAEGNSVSFRMHGPGSAAGVIGQEIGLEPAWEQPGDEAYGISDSDVEGLSRLPDETEFIYWGNEDEQDPITTVLADNAVWQQLPFVQADRVHRGAEGIWVYGGTPSLSSFARDLAADVTS